MVNKKSFKNPLTKVQNYMELFIFKRKEKLS